jgi:hypothetical protein
MATAVISIRDTFDSGVLLDTGPFYVDKWRVVK